jgi:hypothetical protein
MNITSQSIVNAFEPFNWAFIDFWTRGNTFEAALRCYMAALNKWGSTDPNVATVKGTIDAMIDQNYGWYEEHKKDNWADDFGWWGLASLTASRYLATQSDSAGAKTYFDIAADCWQHMYDQGYDKLGANTPVPYGCANSDGTEEGTRNTITNVNLLLLSIRLYQVVKGTNNPHISDYISMCYRQYIWFATWFNYEYPDGKLPYLGFPPSDPVRYGRLVQERPRGKASYLSDTRPTWKEGWTWSGDQGLLIASLVSLTSLQSDLAKWAQVNNLPFPTTFESDLGAWIASVATGVKMLLFAAPDGVIREAPFDCSFVDDPQDYFCGRGVLLRYLAEFYNDLHPEFDFTAGIQATAAAVVNTASNNVFAQNWTSEATDLVFNKNFTSLWTPSDPDPDSRWSFVSPNQVELGVIQATGIDVLGAAILVT